MNKGTNSKETWGQRKQDTNENHDLIQIKRHENKNMKQNQKQTLQ